MERLTAPRCSGIKSGYWSTAKKDELVQRLGQYEDTGLTPEEIRRMKDAQTAKEDSMKAFVRPQVAVDYLRDVGFSIGKDTLQLGLQQRVFPFGDYIKAPAPGGQDVYLIYPALLAKWAAERSPVAKPEDAERIGVKEKDGAA